MGNIINRKNKPICYPVNAFSCLPKDAIESKYNEKDNRWYYKTSKDEDYKTMDIEDAKKQGYYVPEINSVYVTNRYVFSFILGLILVFIGVTLLLIFPSEVWQNILDFYTNSTISEIILIELITFILIIVLFYITQIITERNYTKEY